MIMTADDISADDNFAEYSKREKFNTFLEDYVNMKDVKFKNSSLSLLKKKKIIVRY